MKIYNFHVFEKPLIFESQGGSINHAFSVSTVWIE